MAVLVNEDNAGVQTAVTGIDSYDISAEKGGELMIRAYKGPEATKKLVWSGRASAYKSNWIDGLTDGVDVDKYVPKTPKTEPAK